MRAVALDYASRRITEAQLNHPGAPGDTEVLFQVREVGVCGTDRELATFQHGYPPEGEAFLVPGHEAIGQAVAVGRAVENIRPGDWVAPMIRRPCEPRCSSCARRRADLCLSGRYRERGIFGAHGYLTEYAVDAGEHLVRVPAELADFGVLLEPLSVVEKAVEMALRLREPGAETAVVLGAGTIGILAALTLGARGLLVTIQSMEPMDHPRIQWLRRAGITYARAGESADRAPADIVIEAAGSAEAAWSGIRQLAPLGVCIVLGSRDAYGEMPFRELVLKNQVIAGSINAAPDSFSRAVEDLKRFDRSVLRQMVRRTGFSGFREELGKPPGDAPKLVHVIAE